MRWRTLPTSRKKTAKAVANPYKPDALWEKMYHLFTLREDEFNQPTTSAAVC